MFLGLAVIGLLPASGASLSSAVTGVVRDTKGTPQMGAMVQLLTANSTVVAEAYTNLRGGFAFEHVLPGTYQMKATGASFLPTLRENLHIRSNSKTVVNLTLNTLFEAIQWLPAEPRSPNEPSDDWKWTLRSSSNRPLLRFLEDGPLVVVTAADSQSAPQLEARVDLSGSSREFGQDAARGAFEVERSSADGGHLILRADMGPDPSLDSLYMAGFERPLGPGREVRTMAAVVSTPGIETSGGSQNFQAVLFRAAETINLGPNLSADFGNQTAALHGPSNLISNSPYAAVSWHSGGASVTYDLSTSPQVQSADQIADTSTLAPMFTEENGTLRFEQGLHQELRIEEDSATLRALVAFYHDQIANPIVGGGGNPSAQDFSDGNLLYDPFSQVLRATGPGYTTAGFRAEVEQRFSSSTWASFSYADGKALVSAATAPQATVSDALYAISARRSQAVAASVNGTLAHTGTHWRASYRWQPAGTVNSVDLFDNPSQDAFLSLLIRQPIRCGRLLPNGTEALIAVRNLLREGYRPFVTPDGSTLYFAQADRSIQGGLSFSF
ncbi:MAG TPA: carboxypeptidase-like regulatory domain-containing protein [Acidobacteriaceae bacterium]|nr:carboxypeptidase-like regulatory domain-containing protein [Acidobacteriaceae bacterium]